MSKPTRGRRTLWAWLADAWLVLTNPGCWNQLYPYSEGWDARLRKLMEDDAPVKRVGSGIVGRCYRNVDGVVVWIENHPYASMRTVDPPRRPRRATVIRAMRWLERKEWEQTDG